MMATGSEADEICANCGRPGGGLGAVRRVYVAVDDDGRVTGSETVADPEKWCPSCLSLYPHVPVGADPGDDPGPGHPPPGAESS
jgi:hypothetical protein